MKEMSDAIKAQFKAIFDATRTGGMGMSNIPKDTIIQITADDKGLDADDPDDNVVRLQLRSEKGAYDATIYGVVGMRILTDGTAAKLNGMKTSRDLDRHKDVSNLKQYAATLNAGDSLMDLKFKCLGHVPTANAFAKANSEDPKMNNPVRYTNISYEGYDEYQEALDVKPAEFSQAIRSATPKLLRSGLIEAAPANADRMMTPVFQIVD